MSLIPIIVIAIILLTIAYFTYGTFVSNKLKINDENITPAHKLRDDVDYMPTKTPIVLGHHFASIAGAGPIVGPIIAVAFGWIPALIWIIVGGIFFGAVHDLTSMMASIRHQGKSIGEVIERYIGISGKNLFMIFAFATLILIIAVFMDIVARTFVSVPSAASASVMFMGLALVFGVVMKRARIPFAVLTIAGVAIMYFMVYLGTIYPMELSYWTWILILMGYIFLAAIAPLWVLLQPRDYLNSFLLYGMMLFGLLGIFWANPQIEMTTAVEFEVDTLGYIFPVLFVTIACGAISGFHSMVASGTTSKQINRETDAKKVGFGGMLIESMLAVVSVGTVIILTREEYMSSLAELGPVTLYSQGLGGFISSLGIAAPLAIAFVALTVSAFAVTTLDTCTRLARFLVQEQFQKQSSIGARVLSENRYLATGIVILFSCALLFTGQFQQLWPIFGSANQLLAAIALLTATVWLYKSGINPLFTLIPMVFMFVVTITSLAIFAWKNFAASSYVLAVVALLLCMLSVALIVFARRSLKSMLDEPKG
ncbi:MAG: carbon starvation protein A [Bacteroidetes bacterium]|nr:carbon starvation protein A [Bacteroidota bacterium]MCH8524937.1 carbon starvation protein A [Balneolales bacterium]